MSQHLHKEMRRLESRLMVISRLAEASINKAINALNDQDATLAKDVIKADYDIDVKEVELEEECLKSLALYQPVARDLRFIIAILKINNDLERVGDLAANIAEKALSLSKLPKMKSPFDIQKMAYKAWNMVHQSLLALSNLDKEVAIHVCEQDSIVDDMHADHKRLVRRELAKDHTPEESEYLIGWMSASRNLERVADHATNIAEDVIYMIEGEIVRHKNMLR